MTNKGHTMNYATQEKPNGRFREGTIIRVKGASCKTDNGTFRLESPFPEQSRGGSYFQWRRLKKNGEIVANPNIARNLRGGRVAKLEGWISAGICEIVSEPEVAAPAPTEPVTVREAKPSSRAGEPIPRAPEQADLFGSVIYSYTRKQALADGVLHDVSKLASEAGITFPVACTTAVWAMLNPERMPCGQSFEGRGWDLVWMLRCSIKAGARGSNIRFQVIFGYEGPRGGYKQKLTNLKAVCGPGDDAEPVITIMLPEED
jgi:hypothetical protein